MNEGLFYLLYLWIRVTIYWSDWCSIAWTIHNEQTRMNILISHRYADGNGFFLYIQSLVRWYFWYVPVIYGYIYSLTYNDQVTEKEYS